MEAQHPSCSLRSGLSSPLTEGTFSIPSELLFRLSLAIFFTVVPPHLNSLNDENAGAPCKDRIRSLPHPCSPDKVCCLNVNCWRAASTLHFSHQEKWVEEIAGHMAYWQEPCRWCQTHFIYHPRCTPPLLSGCWLLTLLSCPGGLRKVYTSVLESGHPCCHCYRWLSPTPGCRWPGETDYWRNCFSISCLERSSYSAQKLVVRIGLLQDKCWLMGDGW